MNDNQTRATLTAAVRSHRRGQLGEWGACFCAARVVGLRNGQTRELAELLALSVDAVESRARAAVTWYSLMGPGGPFRDVSERRAPTCSPTWTPPHAGRRRSCKPPLMASNRRWRRYGQSAKTHK